MCGGTVGWDIVLQGERLWVQFPMGSLNFSLTQSFWPHYGPGFESAPNRNEYQGYLQGGKGCWCIGLTTSPPSHANCLEILGVSASGALRTCLGLYWDSFTFTYSAGTEWATLVTS